MVPPGLPLPPVLPWGELPGEVPEGLPVVPAGPLPGLGVLPVPGLLFPPGEVSGTVPGAGFVPFTPPDGGPAGELAGGLVAAPGFPGP